MARESHGGCEREEREIAIGQRSSQQGYRMKGKKTGRDGERKRYIEIDR